MVQARQPMRWVGTGLRYADCNRPGITRVRRGKSFIFLSATGVKIGDPKTSARLKGLAIPPAWERVWICPDAKGHIQATGFDARGRRQYQYHADWTAQRNLTKFGAMLEFAGVLPKIRRRVGRDLALRGMPREKVLACILWLLDATLIRIGNTEYKKANESYGLTTILNNHARIRGEEIAFKFRAKSGKECNIKLHDRRVAKIVRQCQELPGQELFGYVNGDGKTRDVGSGDVNQYMQSIAGMAVTAKDFRTWNGTVIAAETLLEQGAPVVAETGAPISQAELKRREVASMKAAASALCNTVSTCRKFYVHPRLIEAYRDGELHKALDKARGSRKPATFTLGERAVFELMRGKYMKAEKKA